MSSSWTRTAITLFLLISLSTVAGAQVEGTKKISLDPIGTVDVPTDTKLVGGQIPGRDFKVYVIYRGTLELLDVYLGSWPNFPIDSGPKSIKLGDCNALSVLRSEPESIGRDVLVRFRLAPDIPQAAHFYYRDLPPKVAAEADAIMASLRLSAPVECLK